jgi:hypothetical protein
MVKAIDIHVHPPAADVQRETDEERKAREARRRPGQMAGMRLSADELAEYYAELNMMAVLMPMDTESATGEPPMENAYVADLVRRHPGQFVGFGAVDPRKGKVAVQQLDEVVDLGLKGLKLHPGGGAFYANDRAFYPLWERCQELGLITLFHTGTTGLGAMQPGGAGIKLDHMKPVPNIDDVAADFPELTVIMAHPPFPWDREGLAMLIHKSNVYMDLSGWAPVYFDPLVVEYAKTIGQNKMLYGSDWPALLPERWTAEFDAYEVPEPAYTKIMHDNAAKLLGLDPIGS